MPRALYASQVWECVAPKASETVSKKPLQPSIQEVTIDVPRSIAEIDVVSPKAILPTRI
jgi:hypothetical protein